MRTPAAEASSPGTPTPPQAEPGEARKSRPAMPPVPEAAQPVPMDPDGVHALAPGLPRQANDDPNVESA